jgi:hypothetical protein
MADSDLLNKYNVPVPGYTSYPAVSSQHRLIAKMFDK